MYRAQGHKYRLRYIFTYGRYMAEKTDWEAFAANMLKAELKRKGVTYAQLSELVGDKEVNIRNKLSRGKFTAAFLLQCLSAIGAGEVRL
jgi:hypothetical protein